MHLFCFVLNCVCVCVGVCCVCVLVSLFVSVYVSGFLLQSESDAAVGLYAI